jgi:hypothetical protein
MSLNSLMKSIENNIKKYTYLISQKYNIPNQELLHIWEGRNKKPKVLTEDLGKIFEKAICNLYDIEYDGKYNYSLEEAENIKEKIFKLKQIFPYKIKHCAKNGNKYDFIGIEDITISLSAKTSKKDGKVCPQVIGQPSRKKFCEFFNIDITSDSNIIKEYIEKNVNTMLYQYTLNTFHSRIIYYNKYKNLILFITLKEKINWNEKYISFSHINNCKKWNESTSIIVDNVTIGEFQVHNHRDCIKFRWNFEKLLSLYKDNFEVVNLNL